MRGWFRAGYKINEILVSARMDTNRATCRGSEKKSKHAHLGELPGREMPRKLQDVAPVREVVALEQTGSALGGHDSRIVTDPDGRTNRGLRLEVIFWEAIEPRNESSKRA
jgi:hypothetical protein